LFFKFLFAIIDLSILFRVLFWVAFKIVLFFNDAFNAFFNLYFELKLIEEKVECSTFSKFFLSNLFDLLLFGEYNFNIY
jgi:hypothetical protein